MNRKSIIVGFGLVCFWLGAGAGLVWERHSTGEPVPCDSLMAAEQRIAQRRELDRALIRLDIEGVGQRIGLSQRQQEEYVWDIDTSAAKYDVPHLLLHAVCSIESSYDPTAVHPPIMVRGRPTRAVGLTGIVWEYHGERLIAEGIASSRMELSIPSVNIMASAFIIKGMMHDIAKDYTSKGKVLTDAIIFQEFVRRYYGAYDEAYRLKMLVKIKETAGQQWMKRVAQEMVASVVRPTVKLTTKEVLYGQQSTTQHLFLAQSRMCGVSSLWVSSVAGQ